MGFTSVFHFNNRAQMGSQSIPGRCGLILKWRHCQTLMGPRYRTIAAKNYFKATYYSVPHKRLCSSPSDGNFHNFFQLAHAVCSNERLTEAQRNNQTTHNSILQLVYLFKASEAMCALKLASEISHFIFRLFAFRSFAGWA